MALQRVVLLSINLKTIKGGMDSFNEQKDELESSLDEIKSSYGDQIKNIAASVEAQSKGLHLDKNKNLIEVKLRYR